MQQQDEALVYKSLKKKEQSEDSRKSYVYNSTYHI